MSEVRRCGGASVGWCGGVVVRRCRGVSVRSHRNFARNSLSAVSRFEIASLESCGFEPWLETEQFKLRARLLGKVRIWLAVGLRIGYAHVGR